MVNITATLELCPTDGLLWPIFADGAGHVEHLFDATLARLIRDHDPIAGDYVIDHFPDSPTAQALDSGLTLEFTYAALPCHECGGFGQVRRHVETFMPHRNTRAAYFDCPSCHDGPRFPFVCRDCGRPCETEDSDPDCQVLCDACFAGYCQGLGCAMNETRLADGDHRCPKCTEIDRVHAEAAGPRWTAGGLKSETPLDDLPF